MKEYVKTPWVINNFFSDQEHKEIVATVNSMPIDFVNRDNNKYWYYDEECNRWLHSSQWLNKIMYSQLDKARELFNDPTLLPTYALMSLYNDDSSSLDFHTDDNACQYTFDICLYSKDPWPLTIEGVDYTPKNNEAIAFFGEDQNHGRPKISPNNKVLMLFLHYANKNHWFFNYTEGKKNYEHRN